MKMLITKMDKFKSSIVTVSVDNFPSYIKIYKRFKFEIYALFTLRRNIIFVKIYKY